MTALEVARTQLVAARASIDAALALIGPPETPAPVAGPCAHPEGKRKPAPVGGDPGQYLCLQCHSIVSGKAAADGA